MTVSWLTLVGPKGEARGLSLWQLLAYFKGGKGQLEHTLKGNMMISHWME
jgi:hypothetical protein